MVTSMTCMTTMGILYAKSIEKLKKRKTLKMTSRLVDRRWSLIRPFHLGVIVLNIESCEKTCFVGFYIYIT